MGRWGNLQGGLGVCIIVSSAAVGTIATMVTRSMPGLLLGLFVVTGTAVAALAVRPNAGRTILPVPVLAYVVAALISGIVFNRSAASSRAALAIGAAQWIARGFFAMVFATLLAVAITTTRWYLWRRGRPISRDPGWTVPAGPGNPPGRSGTAARNSAAARNSTATRSGGTRRNDAGPRGDGPAEPRPAPRPGPGPYDSEPYNFSSGA